MQELISSCEYWRTTKNWVTLCSLTYLLIVREYAREVSMELTLGRDVIEAYLWQMFAVLVASHTRLIRATSLLGILDRHACPKK